MHNHMSTPRYVSMACPWAHRTLVTRALKGLESAIATAVVHPYMGEDGWHFVDAKGEAGDDSGRCEPEPLFGFHNLSQLYRKASPDYAGRFTVPVLWDKEQSTIVNNESSEIIQVRCVGGCPAGVLPPARASRWHAFGGDRGAHAFSSLLSRLDDGY